MMQFNVVSSHRYSARSGSLTGIASAIIGSFRWGNTAGIKARITSVEWGILVNAGFDAAQILTLDLLIVRGFTASHTGGTALTLTSPATKLRSAATVEATRVTDIRIATTAALGGGAGTLDTIGTDSVWALATTAGARIQKEYDFTHTEAGGIIFQQDEGLALRSGTAFGTGGTAQAYLTIGWDEGLVS
jgi:hypothetical protein